ncbi:NADPH-dependent oxidoreductase [Burkholderia gladioli]|uniref:Nitroreductase n=1 Tax=Burkholderia gladioli (strain BSR3) TaxID=999541 RepID=F2LJ65_BURGS|nr:NADPH-dependent oxidoreductase [Burkholderia gladioli]AEA63755.1 nitroreductase [Burkholderia gladioli BSR3]MBW5281695.1 NADPH-dependent oxidoreductase [Burkholderia gladioli]
MNDIATALDETQATASRHALLRERYGAAWSPAQGAHDAAVNEVIATLLRHRSVRAYADRALPDDILETIAAAAQSAPTSSNLQAWSVVAVRDAERRARLASFAGNQRHVAKAPLLLVFIADLSRLRRVSDVEQMPGDGLEFLEAFLVGVADAAFAAQNTVVALESLGLGCCYIGGMRNQPEAVAQELGLPKEAFAVFGLTIGYPDPEVVTDVKPRLPAPLVLHEERYQAETAEALADYNASMSAFQQMQQMPESGWTGQASRRVRGAQALSGRDRLASALAELGFGLK